MGPELKIIMLEHVPTDAELFELQLRKGSISAHTKRASSKEQFLRMVQEFTPDLVIADISMPRLGPVVAMELAKEVTPGIPWILVSPPVDEDVISECFRRGAADFVSKKGYQRIAQAVRQAMERKDHPVPEVPAPREGPQGEKEEKEGQDGEFRDLSSVFKSITDLVAIVDLEGRRLYNSPSYRDVLEEPEELLGTNSFMDVHPEDRELVKRAFHEALRTGKGQRIEYRLMGGNGEVRYIESQSNLLRDEHARLTGLVIVSREITARKRAEESLMALIKATARSNEGFFPGLVRHLAGHLGVRFALVSECEDDVRNRVRVLAYSADGRPVAPFEYDVAGTTCEQVIKQGKTCYFPSNVQELFPHEKALVAMKACCYLGVPLMNEQQCPIGHLFIMDDKPLADPAHAMEMVTIFAGRAAEELRKRH